jgi:hypothetical protein
MEKSSKRGKIPQADWPLIMARYEAGETLSSIARTYDCSPPAISYIVSRSRGKPANEPTTPTVSEPQLVKAPANGTAANGLTATASAAAAPAVTELRREPVFAGASADRHGEERGHDVGDLFQRNDTADQAPTPAPVATQVNGDQRRKLHLSLGNGSQSAGNGHAPEPPPAVERLEPSYPPANRPPPQYPGAAERHAPTPTQAPPRPADSFDYARRDRGVQDTAPRKDNGAFIDQELRSRVDGDIAAFLAAFDAALAADTQESRFGLREATDRLLRAGARTRIELERLEARVPLSPRDHGGQTDPGAWRHR